tara:strand:+ start:1791 stop:1973 length:183 start_codon:yes stop_codon:yes gene_type:complete
MLTAIPGKKVKKRTNKENDPISLSSKNIISKRNENNASISSKSLQYQYSDLMALPLKTVY